MTAGFDRIVSTDAPSEPPGLMATLAARARTTPDPWLIGLETFGVLTVLAVIAWLPNRPAFALPGLVLIMFALWGVTEHFRLQGRAHRSRTAGSALRALQVLAVAAGTLAAAAALYALVGRLIGSVVS